MADMTLDQVRAWHRSREKVLRGGNSSVHRSMAEAIDAHLSGQDEVPTSHPDEVAVDRFAVEMKTKLAAARAKGRAGWQDKTDCPQQRLSDMLRDHVAKGDPRDVANFCMMLHQRGESILPADAGVAETLPAELYQWLDDRELIPDVDEDGSFDISSLIAAINDHENQLIAARHARQGEAAYPELARGWRAALDFGINTLDAEIDIRDTPDDPSNRNMKRNKTILQKLLSSLKAQPEQAKAGDSTTKESSIVPGGWSGWATQYPNRMPKLCGVRLIAELNYYPEEGQRLIYLAECAAPTTFGEG